MMDTCTISATNNVDEYSSTIPQFKHKSKALHLSWTPLTFVQQIGCPMTSKLGRVVRS
jgi:hypothetical protein